MMGQRLSFKKHAVIEFGAYVQTHEQHSNDMSQRTMGCICLGPTGNAQGGHWFMSLTSGERVARYRWTELPMPGKAIDRVAAIGRRQRMPSTLTYANRHGYEIGDRVDEHPSDDESDDEDSSYQDSQQSDDELDDFDDNSSNSDESESNFDDDDGDDDDEDDHDGETDEEIKDEARDARRKPRDMENEGVNEAQELDLPLRPQTIQRVLDLRPNHGANQGVYDSDDALDPNPNGDPVDTQQQPGASDNAEGEGQANIA
jgi:hypothetical protein